MGVDLIITKSIDRNFKSTGKIISKEEWRKLVEQDESLRFNTEPHVFINPRTNQTVKMPAGQLEAEFLIDGEYVGFLRYFGDGKLIRGYPDFLDDKENPVRLKIVEVAEKLGALITVGGEQVLDW